MSQETKLDGQFHYRIYGLILQTNQPVDHLYPAPIPSQVDVHVYFETIEHPVLRPSHALTIYQSSTIGDQDPIFQVWRDDQALDAYLGVQYRTGNETVTFLCDHQGSSIRVLRAPGIPFQDMITYLLGPVIGCLLRLRRVTCLHAAVVAKNGRALAVIGPKGSGKSTAAAAFAQQGCAVLSDDLAPLTERDGRFIVSPGYPNLRIWSDTADALSEVDSNSLAPILSISDKRFLTLELHKQSGPWRFHTQPIALEKIYILGARSRSKAVTIKPLSQTAGLLALVEHVYPVYDIRPSDRVRDFTILTRLAAKIPVHQVWGLDNLNALPQMTGRILSDFLRK